MAKTYKLPGVYIQEIPKSLASVKLVETAIPIFIGYTEKASMSGAAKRITSLLDYESYFGKGVNEVITVDIKEVYTMIGGSTEPELKERLIRASAPDPSIHTMYYQMQLYFANGGGPCYIVSVGDTKAESIDKDDLIAGLEIAKGYDEPTLLVFPQVASIVSTTDAYDVYDLALMQAGELGDRFVLVDCHGDDPATLRYGLQDIGASNLKYGAAYHPFLRTTINYQYDVADTARFTINLERIMDDGGELTDGLDVSASLWYGELGMELQSLVDIELEKLHVTLPPSVAIAGVYVLVDGTRGVWKSPANVSLNLVCGLTKEVTDDIQAYLNVDTVGGKSINAIRAFTGRGILVWGARTLAGNDNEWRYISVRRFFNMVEESCIRAIEGFASAPNNPSTWTSVQGMLEDFLITLWRQGALQGAKPEHAFYVAIGLNKTMTVQDIQKGRMIVEIGLSAVRSAEFIIIRFSQTMVEN